MEDTKTLFCFSKFSWACQKKFLWNLWTVWARGLKKFHQPCPNVVRTFLGYWDLICKLSGFSLSFLLNELISMLKQCLSEWCCWLAIATGITEPLLGFLRSCNLWAQLTLLISTALTLYTFFNFLWIFVTYSSSAQHGSVGLDIALQAGRLRVWFPVGSLGFFIGLILAATLWPWG
jgi:hypothetical protein